MLRSRPRTIRALLVLIAAASPAGAAEAPDAGAMAEDLVALAAPGGDLTVQAAGAELAPLVAALAAGDEAARRLPAALAQGAELARTAEHPASRAVFADLTRDMLITAVTLSGRAPADSALVAAWADSDPMVAELAPGQGLAASDLAAMDRLAAHDPAHKGIGLREFWDAQAARPENRILPTRMQAWADGVQAAWDQLDAAERKLAVQVLDNPAIPPAPLLEKVIGTADMLGWLTAADVPMTSAEAAASPDLLHYMQGGAFAGPLRAPLEELMALTAAAGGGDPVAVTTGQLMRLNNWSAIHGETHSSGAYRAMTEGGP